MLSIDNIEKSYGTKKILDGVSMFLDEGKIVAVLGPNGSGKTTLLNIVSGFNRSDNGEVYIDNKPVSFVETRADIGYMQDVLQISEKTKVNEFLNLVNHYKYADSQTQQLEEMIQEFDLTQLLKMAFGKLSYGNKRKVNILVAFLGFPKVIILDEPTNGIDTKGIILLKKYIQKAKEKGSTVVITSHVLDFVQTVCDEFYFLKNGNIAHVLKGAENIEEIYKDIYLRNETVINHNIFG